MAYPQILQDVVNFIKSVNYTASNKFTEGRRNSQQDEDNILELLQNHFGSDVIIGQPSQGKRSIFWYDFIVKDPSTGNHYPVNLKSTMLLAKPGIPDNAGQKIGMLYALTTIPFVWETRKGVPRLRPSSGVVRRADRLGDDEFERLLFEYKGDAKRDYYYIVMNKEDTSDTILVPLRDCIAYAGRNACVNLPFQINWGLNRNQPERTFREAWNHLVVDVYKKNVEIRIQMLSSGPLLSAEYDQDDSEGNSILGFDD